MDEELEEICKRLRNFIKEIAEEVFALREHKDLQNEQLFTNQHSEIHANLMLTYRHLEDARMRLGKVMQQIQGGISIFDRDKNPDNKEEETK